MRVRLTFHVSRAAGGWIVRADEQIGPVLDRQGALDLAHGMAAALRRTGDDAEVILDEVAGDAGGAR